MPRGFAHGFVVLEDETTFAYKVDNYYSPEYDRTIAYNDPAIGIDWGIEAEKILLSEKDRQALTLQKAEKFHYQG